MKYESKLTDGFLKNANVKKNGLNVRLLLQPGIKFSEKGIGVILATETRVTAPIGNENDVSPNTLNYICGEEMLDITGD